MHDFLLTQNLLDLALKNANSRRILNVNLLIGPFSNEREESIRFYWRDLAKGTPGEGAQLHFTQAETDMKCVACGGALILDEGSICTFCQNGFLQLLDGENVKLESIEVE